MTHQLAYRVGTTTVVPVGSTVESFRGETWRYDGIESPAKGASQGRVKVSTACDDCMHAHHRDGIMHRAFYPSVFGLELR